MIVPAPYRIEALGRQHRRDDFQCGQEALDRYLKQQARQDADKHVAAPFVLVAGDDPAVLGYYTLCASSIVATDIAPELASKLPRYPRLPVTLLGRLAVDIRLKGQGQGGAFLLMDALRRSFEHAASIAAVAVVVDAKDDTAAAFYRPFHFLALQKHPRRLHLPMKTVGQLVTGG